MFARLVKPLALAVVLLFGCSWFAQPAEGQTVAPYGPYGYTPGAYDYSPSPRSYNGSQGPRYSYGFDFGLPAYGRYGYSPGTYNNNYSRFGSSPSYSHAAFTYNAPPGRFGTMPLQPANQINDRTVRIQVRVPANAKIWFDGEATTQRGEVRTFESPALDPAKRYSYEIRATWQQDGRTVERTRQLRVHAGDRINVNLAGS